ncbi:hypothetical protein HY415_01955 [Candidatus Kaiserbacteria bacterium]|nr:hypothetical protein [Candidatus Kaiserbacteria bacterium]
MSTDQAVASQPTGSVYRTFKTKIRVYENWGEFLEVAASPSLTFGQKLGAVHDVFNLKLGHRPWDFQKGGSQPYLPSDRFEFLFGVADGWTDVDAHRTKGISWNEEPQFFAGRRGEGGTDAILSESQMRQILARKALDMLVANLFSMPSVREARETNRKEYEEEAMLDLVSGPVFPMVQAFFRVEKDSRRVRIQNLPGYAEEGSHSGKTIVNFLPKLAKFMWEWPKSRNFRDQPGVIDRINEAKPWMVEVLNRLGELRMLVQWTLELDEPCLDKLREIAFRAEFNAYQGPLYMDRNVETLEEACYLGSTAAWILKRHELMTLEHKRLTAIQEALEAKADAEEQVRKLTGASRK